MAVSSGETLINLDVNSRSDGRGSDQIFSWLSKKRQDMGKTGPTYGKPQLSHSISIVPTGTAQNLALTLSVGKREAIEIGPGWESPSVSLAQTFKHF